MRAWGRSRQLPEASGGSEGRDLDALLILQLFSKKKSKNTHFLAYFGLNFRVNVDAEC